MILTDKAYQKIELWESLYPGKVRVVMVTRNAARLEVMKDAWTFEVGENGRLELKSHKLQVQKPLLRLAFYRAAEAIWAVRCGLDEIAAEPEPAAQKRITAKALKKRQLELFGE